MWIDERQRRLLCSVDLVGFGQRDDRSQASVETSLLSILDRAGASAGLHRELWMRQVAGDSEVAVLPDSEPEHTLVDDYIRQLSILLADHNFERNESNRLRMRVAIHHDVVYRADLGFAGRGIVDVTRLRDCAPARKLLRAAPAADLVLVLGQVVYDGTVRQRATSLPVKSFRGVAVHTKDFDGVAWLYCPGVDVHAVDFDADVPAQPGGEGGEPGASPRSSASSAVVAAPRISVTQSAEKIVNVTGDNPVTNIY